MLDLSNERFRLLEFNIYFNLDGTISTYNQNGVIIADLSGDWSIIHKVKNLISIANRKQYVADNYDDSITPDINLYIRLVAKNGSQESIHPINNEQFYKLSQYIKQ